MTGDCDAVYRAESGKLVMKGRKENKQKVSMDGKEILVTGAAGFIGANLILQQLEECTDSTLMGLDNMNPYYDVGLKNTA